MELVYSLDFRALPRARDWKVEENTCCSLSCRNILAFSRPNTNVKESVCPFEVQYEACVLDLDKPWEEFVVCRINTPISHIKWDPTGWRLLVVDCEGNFDLWQMQDYLLNKWVKFDSCTLAGEEVLALTWLHNGIQIPFSPDKRDSVLYSDKFPRTKFKPTLALFGSKAMEGWVAVTATGLVSVGLIQEQERKVVTAQENLAPAHLRLSEADVAFTNSGEIIIATSDGLMTSAIQCFTISVKMLQLSHHITCRAGASLYMRSQVEYGERDHQGALQITQLRFMNHENSDTLLIGCGGHGYSSIEVWQLVEQTMSLHRMFQNTANSDYAYKTPKWMHKATIAQSSMITSIACPQISVSRNIVDPAGFVSYFAAAYRDGSVKIIHRQSFQVIVSCSWESLIGIHYNLPGDKTQRSASHMTTIQQTPSGCGLIGFSGDKMYTFQVFNIRDGPIQLMPPVMIHLMEYVMYVGHDWWDVLLIIGQGLIERICQRLMDNFQKQPISLQELLRIRLVRLRIGLYSCLTAGHQKASDCHALLSLFAIASVLKGILRPKTVSAQDKSPSEKLANVCGRSTEQELETVLASLDTDEFIVESNRSAHQAETSLQPLQPFIQWVADFSLHLLSSAPLYQSYSSFLGSSLLRDGHVLQTLRELIVIIRVWGVINSACLPAFTNMTHMDCMAHIYKLLTKAWSCVREGNIIEYDDALMDECCHLPSKVIIPNMRQSFGEENFSFSVFSQAYPLSFFVGHEPDYLYNLKKSRHYTTDVAIETKQHHDVVRHIYLGTNPGGKVRECCRCGGMSLIHSTAKSPILKSWEQRFVKMCICGGHWKLRTTNS